MSEEITIPQLKQIDALLKDLRHERERVRIGFLDSETPRLLNLLNDIVSTMEYLQTEFEKGKRELRRLKRKERKLKEKRELKPVPLTTKEPKRDKAKRKKMESRLQVTSRKHL